MPHSSSTNSETWLLRMPEVFADWHAEVLEGLEVDRVRLLGKDYAWVKLRGAAKWHDSPASKFVSWRLPVQHSWPCNPKKIDGFIEKAAQALAGKFGGLPVQGVMMGALDPGGDRYFRTLASNLRGRSLQLFAPEQRLIRDAEEQDAQQPSLFALVGREGLFAGVLSPQQAGGFYPGGTKFVRQNAPTTISRAGAKIAEALHHLRLHGSCPSEGAHWLELGASPGGMTAELLARGYRVTAIDRAAMDARLRQAAGLTVVQADAAEFRPPPQVWYDAILSDMNGDALLAFSHVVRLSRFLKPGGLIVFTLKLAGAPSFSEANELEAKLSAAATQAGLKQLACMHLTYNRMEFTCLFQS